METKQLTTEMKEALAKPLPAEAVSQHPTKPYLSSIKAIYVVDRLNEVFGTGRWFQTNKPMDSDGKMKVVHSTLEIPEYGIKLENFGGNDNVDEGDAWKGAATDALTKMASYLGIGMDVFKGKANTGQSKSQTGYATPKQKEFIAKLMNDKGITLEMMASDGIDKTTPATEVIDYLKAAPDEYTREKAMEIDKGN